MTGTVPTPLAPLVQKFFTERLISQLGASANTIASYRDTFRLLLEFAEARCGLASTDMDISDIDADLVGNFLEHLETERGNRAQSRNVRLAAIRSFIRYVAVNEPQVLHHCQKILQLPAKRHKRGTVNWLTEDEVEALAAQVRTAGRCSRRTDRPSGVGTGRPQDPGRRTRTRCPCAVPWQGAQGPCDTPAERYGDGHRTLDQ